MIPRIEALAANFLKDRDQHAAPVDVRALAEQLDVKVIARPLSPDVSGMLIREQGHTIIGVNASHAETRQRFTIAHELGHLLLHKGAVLYVDGDVRLNLRDSRSSLAVDREEVEANSFAAALLMPKPLVDQAVDELMDDIDDVSLVRLLAGHFQVSTQAASYRLINLGLMQPVAD